MLPPDRSQGTCGAGSWGPGVVLGMGMPGWGGQDGALALWVGSHQCHPKITSRAKFKE